MNILHFIRKNLGLNPTGNNKGKQFDQGVGNLEKKLKDNLLEVDEKKTSDEKPDFEIDVKMTEGENDMKNLAKCLPQNWSCKKHDKALLKAAAKHGLLYLPEIIGHKDHGLEDISLQDLLLVIKGIEKPLVREFVREIDND